jgi:hypothetical protein
VHGHLEPPICKAYVCSIYVVCSLRRALNSVCVYFWRGRSMRKEQVDCRQKREARSRKLFSYSFAPLIALGYGSFETDGGRWPSRVRVVPRVHSRLKALMIYYCIQRQQLLCNFKLSYAIFFTTTSLSTSAPHKVNTIVINASLIVSTRHPKR